RTVRGRLPGFAGGDFSAPDGDSSPPDASVRKQKIAGDHPVVQTSFILSVRSSSPENFPPNGGCLAVSRMTTAARRNRRPCPAAWRERCECGGRWGTRNGKPPPGQRA